MDRELPGFSTRINQEVHDRLGIGDTDSGEVYSENIFTELLMEHLASIGMIDNGQVCHYEGSYGRSSIKINGFALNDDEDHLDLFATVFTDSVEPRNVYREDIVRASERALRFFEAAAGGMHNSLEPSGEAFEIARKISETISSIERGRPERRLERLRSGGDSSQAARPRLKGDPRPSGRVTGAVAAADDGSTAASGSGRARGRR
jgi:hypothetical protein